MTVLPSTIVRPVFARPRISLSGLFSACRKAVARYLARREAIARLQEFDEAGLQDIGLVRSQIEGAVRGLARPDRRRR